MLPHAPHRILAHMRPFEMLEHIRRFTDYLPLPLILEMSPVTIRCRFSLLSCMFSVRGMNSLFAGYIQPLLHDAIRSDSHTGPEAYRPAGCL